MIKILINGEYVLMPKNGFYIIDGHLCNIYTGAVLGLITKEEEERIVEIMEIE